jgi:hypothetical protein
VANRSLIPHQIQRLGRVYQQPGCLPRVASKAEPGKCQRLLRFLCEVMGATKRS